MSRYPWTRVPFANTDHTTDYVPGIRIGAYTVGPIQMLDDTFSASVWRVSDGVHGVMFAEYTSLTVAINLAHYLNRVHGDLSAYVARRLAGAFTSDDFDLYERLDKKLDHVARFKEKFVDYIPFKEADY